ncbi:LemA family protein [Cellulophaga sp. E6(2014)]|uniref:LemA family protein n=1 Tax=Cellulophaga sp. E6(2014) TaxID=1495334 RepID=UPI00051CFA34|nr:LemA family protein [Cellulophaga sp. E6(2014)]KGK30853.1 membrane protein [Cellulophaga sp. E6(2014)]
MIFLVVLAIILIPVFMGISIYNGLVRKKTLMKEGWSSIDVFLKKRNDLIPNLIETVKGYATHEKTLFENVTKSRNMVQNANTVADQSAAENALKNSMMNLFAVSENYPDLKANQNFIELQNELTSMEEEIEMVRRYYNGTVTDNNIAIETFPSNIVANMFNFEKGTFFEIKDAAQREPVKVSF